MKILKGQLLFIKHSRKGNFYARAVEDFDSDKVEFYPIVSDEIRTIEGLNNEWEQGERVSCRGSFCTFEIIKDAELQGDEE